MEVLTAANGTFVLAWNTLHLLVEVDPTSRDHAANLLQVRGSLEAVSQAAASLQALRRQAVPTHLTTGIQEARAWLDSVEKGSADPDAGPEIRDRLSRA